jgi:hypothetical protein
MKKTMHKSDVATASASNGAINLAINLCVDSYRETIDEIITAVQNQGQSIVWGPAEALHDGVPYSLMFVAYDPTTTFYYVVMRGTNPVSLFSWITEDFEIHNTVPFTNYVGSAPADALISLATSNGLNDLLALTDPTTGQPLMDYLQSIQPCVVFVTGHSLGGTLVPPLYAMILDQVYGGNNGSLGYYSFAGLTSGNNLFAQYFNTIVPSDSVDLRVVNPLDIAANCWGNYFDLVSIYDAYGMPWSSVPAWFRDAIDAIFASGVFDFYTQPADPMVLPTVFSESNPDWLSQAAYQHHATTYQALVEQQFPK